MKDRITGNLDENGRVVVLLSFYRGEKYIQEQIQSILDQDYEGEIRILIRDDGSDSLEKVQMPCMEGHVGLRTIIKESGINLGPQKSFLQLIQTADEAAYYFFADQDDVWMPEKIRTAVTALREVKEPALWCCNYNITDSELRVLQPDAVRIVERTFHFLYAQMYNTFPGCVMGMNKELFMLLRRMNLSDCMMQDSLAFSTAIATGTVIYEEKSMIQHRIHGSNVVGAGFHKSTPLQWIREKTHLLIHKEPYDLTEFAKRLLECADVKEEWRSEAELLHDYKKTIGNTLRLFFHPELRRKVDPEVLSIHCKILFRLF